MSDSQQTPAPDGIPWLGVSVNLVVSAAISIAMGMLAIVVPVALESRDFSRSAIGILMSLETIASVLICFALVRCYRTSVILGSLWLSLVPRVGGLGLMAMSDSAVAWALGITLHGLGTYGFLLMTQAWVNAIPFRRSIGLWMAVYSTSMSVGFAIGPVVLNWINAHPAWTESIANALPFLGAEHGAASALLLLIAGLHVGATFPLILCRRRDIPRLDVRQQLKIWSVVQMCKGPMFAIAMAGVSYFGVSAFIVVYGMHNGISPSQAALLVTFFSVGSIVLEVPLGFVSDRFDRRFVLVGCAFLCMVCAAYLPIVIDSAAMAWSLVFLWGGVIGAIYSISLAMIGERFSGEKLLAANSAYTILEGIGGTLSVLLIGFTMDHLGSDGLPYVIMLASILFFAFSLTRYRVT